MTTHEQPLTQALLTSLHKYRPQLHGKRIWLACSGGRDSMSLAMLCRQLFEAGQLPFLPQLLHFNHGMQQANTAWSQQVLAWSQHVGMPCKVLTLESEVKNEQSARRARYNAMMQLMNFDDVLMLGHHQDDQVETVLMRLFNGAGVNGLSGMTTWRKMRYVSNSPKTPINAIQSSNLNCTDPNASNLNSTNQLQHDKFINLWRPWLGISRAQITNYAKASGLKYIDDPTNIVSDNTTAGDGLTQKNKLKVNDRAWLRSELMPLIKARYPQVNEAIFRSSLLMQDATHIISNQAKQDLSELVQKSCSLEALDELHSVIDIKKLIHLPLPQQSSAIHSWLNPHVYDLPPPKRLVDEVLLLCQRKDNNHQTVLSWDSGRYQYQIRRYQNQLFRLRADWAEWLEISPVQQTIGFNTQLPGASLNNLADRISLKNINLPIQWQLKGLDTLIEMLANVLKTNRLNDDASNNVSCFSLNFEPLPRNLKLTLAGRQGSKTSKKLMQAINQPAFMRSSLVLCSLVCSQTFAKVSSHHVKSASVNSTDAIANFYLNNLNDDSNSQTNSPNFESVSKPLFIIGIEGIYPLENIYKGLITQLISHNKLMSCCIINKLHH